MELPPGMFTLHEDVLSVDVNNEVYSRDAVLRTSYWFTDRCYILITRPSGTIFRVQFKVKTATAELLPVVLEEIAGEFLNALLDHQIRQDIETETGRVRELLIAKAFAASGVLDDPPPGDPGDPVDKRAEEKNSLVQIESDS